MDFIPNLSLAEQLDILFKAKNRGWTPKQEIPLEFHKVHRINLENIVNAANSGLEGYSEWNEAEQVKNKTIINNSLALLEAGQLSGILYFYTYLLLLDNKFYDVNKQQFCNFRTGSSYDIKGTSFQAPTNYDSYIKYLIPNYYPVYYFKFTDLILLPFVGQPSPITNFSVLNKGFIYQIYPIGYSLLESNHYDGVNSNSFNFFKHDINHTNQSVSIIKNDINLQNFLRDLYYSYPIYNKWIQYFIFMIIHEELGFFAILYGNNTAEEIITKCILKSLILTIDKINRKIDKYQAHIKIYNDFVDQMHDLGLELAPFNNEFIDANLIVEILTNKLNELNTEYGFLNKIQHYVENRHNR